MPVVGLVLRTYVCVWSCGRVRGSVNVDIVSVGEMAFYFGWSIQLQHSYEYYKNCVTVEDISPHRRGNLFVVGVGKHQTSNCLHTLLSFLSLKISLQYRKDQNETVRLSLLNTLRDHVPYVSYGHRGQFQQEGETYWMR